MSSDQKLWLCGRDFLNAEMKALMGALGSLVIDR
jgi:hypothetical protein